MCDKAIMGNGGTLCLLLNASKIEKCVINLSIIMLMQLKCVPDCYKTLKNVQ